MDFMKNIYNKFEYIKCFWKYIDYETPVVVFYEVDLENERYATRMIDVFANRKVDNFIENSFEFITEAPVPTVSEINEMDEFFAKFISKEEFEEVYNCCEYLGDIVFPK